MATQIATVATSIAGLSISGVTIYDLDKIPDFVSDGIHALFPKPDGYVTDLRIDRLSTGIGTAAAKDLLYTLHYIFAYSPIGSGMGLDDYDDMVDKVALIIDEITEDNAITGAVDVVVDGVGTFGSVLDPSGKLYNGCEIAFAVREFWS